MFLQMLMHFFCENLTEMLKSDSIIIKNNSVLETRWENI